MLAAIEHVIPAMLLVLGVTAAVLIVLVPYYIARSRKHPQAEAIGIVCFFFGWSGIGWIIALVWAYSNKIETQDDLDKEAQRQAEIMRRAAALLQAEQVPLAPAKPSFPCPKCARPLSPGHGATEIFCDKCGTKLRVRRQTA